MSDALTDRLPPQNRDAERGVIGGILRDPDVLADVLALVRPESMYFDAHQKLLAAIAELAKRNQPIELVGLHDELKRRRELDDVGGREYLIDVWEAAPTGANAVYHAGIVRDTALVRALIHTTNEILRDAYSPTCPAAEMLAAAERKLFALSAEAATGAADPRAIGAIAREVLESLDARIGSGGALSGLSCGYPDLDAVTGGLRPGEMIVIGARPSVGKTAMALNLAERVANAGTPTLLFSMEMPCAEIGARMLAMRSSVSMHRMSRPRELRPEDIDALFAASSPEGLGGTPLYVDDTPDLTAAQVAAVSRRAVRRLGVQLIAIDYLGLMRPESPRDNRTQQIGTLALRMKQMARALGVPVLLLSQLNREMESQNRRPRLSDLRESGDIEAHADRVILLHRELNLPAEDVVWPIDLIIAKNRNGPTGDIRLGYKRSVLRFENYANI